MALGPLLLASLAVNPQQPAFFFPFVIPWDDAVRNTVTDVSFLNSKPAGKNGWILPRNGVLTESKTGKRVKFLGTNFTARAAFPSHEDADKVAARLAKLGINIVRFHHLQNSWDKEKGMIWKQGREMIELDPKQLDRLDYLIAALKRNGIFANVNLQTTRDYLPEMGFPESVKNLPWGYAKRIDKYNPKMIALQKEYARQLIGRRNKYTGLKYTEDPAVMVVEINNENSLVGAPWETLGGGFEGVPEPFKGELRTLWNQWLSKKYSSDQQLERAWSASSTAKGPNVLTPALRWSFEHQGDTRMDATPTTNVGFDANITNNSGPVWALQANITGITLRNGDTYTVTFRGKSDRKRPVTLQGTIDQPDWHGIGLNQRIDLDTEWRDYKAVFTVNGAEPGHNRIGFTMGDAVGRVSIANLSLAPGTDPFKLPAGQSLNRGTVDLAGAGGTAMQASDFMDFLTDTETAYSRNMRNFLKNDLSYKGIVYDTQISWGGLTGLVREQPMEVADNHSYYHHPEFPGAGWDPVNWIVRNSPMVYDLASGKYSELGGLAQYRVAGKPYSISEYNHPAPMDYRAEMMPLISSFGAVQDWDIIYSFDYGTYGKGEPNSQVQGFFGVSSDPTKMAFYPAAAMMFRKGLIPRATAEAILLLPTKPNEAAKTAYAAWAQAGGLPDLFSRRIAIRTESGVDAPRILLNGKSPTSSTIRLTGTAVGHFVEGQPPAFETIYAAVTDTAIAAVGKLGGRSNVLGLATLTLGHFGNDFATMTLTPRDSMPLQRSKRLLLTVAGKIENRNMGWNADRTTVGDKWGTGPTQAEFVPFTLALNVDGPRTVWALDGNGRRKAKLPATYRAGKLTFSHDRAHPSAWFEIAK